MNFRRSAGIITTDNKPTFPRARNHHAPEPPPTAPTKSSISRGSQERQDVGLQDLPRSASTTINYHHHHHHHHHCPHNNTGGLHTVLSYASSSSGYGSSESICGSASFVHCHSTRFPTSANTTCNEVALEQRIKNHLSHQLCKLGSRSSSVSSGNAVHSSGFATPPSPGSALSVDGAQVTCCGQNFTYHQCAANAKNCCGICCPEKRDSLGEYRGRFEVPSTIKEESESYISQVSKSVASLKSYGVVVWLK